MDDPTQIEDLEPKKRRSRVKWFSFVFAAALILLGYRTYSSPTPEHTAETVRALERAGLIFFALGGLALVVGIVGSVVRSSKIKFLEMLEALAFVGSGLFFIAMRGLPEGGGLFKRPAVPIVPIVLITIGIIKGIVAIREYRKLHAR